MSVEAKHAYRFGYLKSERWKNVRLEALVREKAMCQICGNESIANDAHHVWYPENIYETTERHLVILCRPCHDFLHVMLPECKTRDEATGRAEWLKFYNAIKSWRSSKEFLFKYPTGVTRIRELGQLYDDLKKKSREQEFIIRLYEKQFGEVPDKPSPPRKQTVKEQIHALALLSKRLESAYANSEKESVAEPDKEP